MSRFRLFLFVALFACLPAAPAGPGGELERVVGYDWGPFAAHWLDVHGNEHTRALGPFYERMVTPEGWEFEAFRPFSSHWNNQGDGVSRREILWPLAKSSRRGNASSWRVLLAYAKNWDVTDPESRRSFWLLPFYFEGLSAQGLPYRALFPLGGTIREFFLWDKISFQLFPLHVRSQMRDIEADSWLWPLISKTEGPGIERFRAFPFYGYSRAEGRGEKTFVLWPFWNQVSYDIPGSRGEGWILFPLTGHLKLENQESWWFLPPLFRLHVGEEQNRLHGPWPFVQQSSGSVDKFYLWPLFGGKTIGKVRSRFFLWPIGWQETTLGGDVVKKRFLIVPFYQRFSRFESVTRSDGEVEAGELRDRYTKVWPLLEHQSKDGGGIRRTVFPEFNPIRGGPIERNYAPFWHVYLREQIREDKDTQILWGMYRSILRDDDLRYRSVFPLASWSREPDGRHWSLLKGLLGYRRLGGKKQWRVLYLFRFGGKEASRP